MLHHYIIIPGLKLVIQHYTGYVSLKEIMTAKEIILKNPSFQPDFKFIIDVSLATFKMSNAERIIYSEYIKKLVGNGIHLDTALLTCEPNQVAHLKLIDELINKDSNHILGIYSTLRNIVSFFKYDKDAYIHIKTAIKVLKEKALYEKDQRQNTPLKTTLNRSYYRHQILPNVRLIVQCHINYVDFEETKLFKKRIYKDELYQPSYKNIIDMSNAVLGFSPSESKKYASFLVNHYPFSNPDKTAIISTVPLEVAKSFLIKSNLGEFSETRKVFNNVDMALEWLGYTKKHHPEIKKTLKKLNTY